MMGVNSTQLGVIMLMVLQNGMEVLGLRLERESRVNHHMQ